MAKGLTDDQYDSRNVHHARRSDRQSDDHYPSRSADRRTADGGFHEYEADCHLRWTNGHAELPAEAFARFGNGAEVMLYLGEATQYPDNRASVARSAA
jgi:hypothetical protein